MKATRRQPPGTDRLVRMLTAWFGVTIALLPMSEAGAVDCNSFKVWTFNIRFSDGWACVSDCFDSWYRTGGRIARRDVAETYLTTHAPDIFGLQEVRDPAASAGVRASQLDDVASWFPTHGYYEKDRGDGERCAIFYRSSRFVRLDAGTFWLSCFPDIEGSKHPIDHNAGDPARITSWVALLDTTTSVVFYVFNGHWSLNGTSQQYSAALVRQRVQQIAGGLPVILLGDFNSRETEEPFRILTGQSAYPGSTDCLIPLIPVPQAALPLVNSYRQVHPALGADEKTYHAFGGGSSGTRIDHVLHSARDFAAVAAAIRRDTEPGHCATTECYPSDHYAVEVRFRMLLENVSVDFRRTEAVCETGNALMPFNTLTEALDTSKTNGTITLVSGSTSSGIVINPARGPVTITSSGGPSVIGK